MTYSVYALCQPGTGEIRYIGKASSVESRVESHMSEGASSDMRQWMRDIGGKPTVTVLEWHEAETAAYEAEKRLIAEHRSSGNLLNKDYADGRGGTGRAKPKWPGFGARLKMTRKSRKLTTTKLGELCGVSQCHISSLETGRRNLASAECALLLARALDVSLEWLITGEPS